MPEPDPYAVKQTWHNDTAFQAGTKDDYTRDADSWFTWIGEHVWTATPQHIDAWADSLGGAPRSRARRISALRSFYAYALRQHIVRANPARAVLRGNLDDEPNLTTLDKPQAAALISAADRYTGPHPARARALTYLMLGMNLRPSAAVALDLDDITNEGHRRTATILQKGGGTRREEIPPLVWHAIDDYLPRRAIRPPHSSTQHGPVLTSHYGKRLDRHHTPIDTLRDVAATHPLLIDIAPNITADGIAHSTPPW